nr:MAG TPA: hypothetical protein [Caudoviricetes sp.]
MICNNIFLHFGLILTIFVHHFERIRIQKVYK